MNEPSDLTNVERALGSLLPQAIPIDTRRLVWEAGHAAGRRSARLWQATTGLMAVLVAASVLTPITIERNDRVAGTAPLPVPTSTPDIHHAKEVPQRYDDAAARLAAFTGLQTRVLDEGVDVLREQPAADGSHESSDPPTLQKLLEKML